MSILNFVKNLEKTDELDVMFNAGWDECLKEIDAICDELEEL
jgi:hypothetical protein